MKNTHLEALFPGVIRQLAAWQNDLSENPADWHAALQRAIDDGSFIRLQIGFGAGGLVTASLTLLAKDGTRAVPISEAEFPSTGAAHA